MAAGAALGDVGNAIPCGGTPGPQNHVHFFVKYVPAGESIGDIFQNTSVDFDLRGATIGGWLISGSLASSCMTYAETGEHECVGQDVTNYATTSVSDDVSFIKTRNTGSGTIEAFTATAASGYKSGLATKTRFSPGDANNGTWGMLADGDVYFIKTRNTGSGTIEAFTATAASGYKSGLATKTRFSPGDANNGTWGMLADGDVYFIKTRNTGSGTIEAFTATAASGYKSGLATKTRFSPGDANNGTWGMLADGDVYFIKTRNTGSGTIEAFTATAASGYKSGLATKTRFSPGDANNGTWGMLADGDVYFIKTRNTGSGTIEAFTATAASDYKSGLATKTRFSPGDANNGTWGMF